MNIAAPQTDAISYIIDGLASRSVAEPSLEVHQIGRYLDDWLEKNGKRTREDFSNAITNIPIVSFPARWGGGPFQKLGDSVINTLRKHDKIFNVKDPTERYDIFTWAYELIPSMGVFPLYLIPERRASWTVVPIGMQRRMVLIYPKKYAGRTTFGSLSICQTESADAGNFERMVEYFRTHSSHRVRFYYFGPGHVAAKILASSMNNLENRQYFLDTMVYYRHTELVNAFRYRSAVEFGQKHKLIDKGKLNSSFVEKYEELYSDGNIRTQSRNGMLAASIRGLHSLLIKDGEGDFSFVVSDLGVAEFLELKKFPDLEFRVIEHGQRIPVGIGLSMPSLLRLSTASQGFKALTDSIDEWLAGHTSDKDARDSVLEEFGIELDQRTAPDLAADRDELVKFVGDIRHFCAVRMHGTAGGDTPIVKVAGDVIVSLNNGGEIKVKKSELYAAQRLFESLKLANETRDMARLDGRCNELGSVLKKWR